MGGSPVHPWCSVGVVRIGVGGEGLGGRGLGGGGWGGREKSVPILEIDSIIFTVDCSWVSKSLVGCGGGWAG